MVVKDIKNNQYFKELKQEALKSFNEIPKFNKFGNTKSRIVTYDLNTVILDLIQCLYNSKEKREKRLKRINFLMKLCANKNINCMIKPETYKKIVKVKEFINNGGGDDDDKFFITYVSDVINSFVGSIFGIDENKKGNINSRNQSLYMLNLEKNNYNISPKSAKAEKDASIVNVDDDDVTLIKKNKLGDYFEPPEKQHFNNHCKNILNEDGIVYDVFTYVAIIVFKNLITSFKNDVINNDIFLKNDIKINFTRVHQKLLDSFYLIFKGGAAIVKHILQNDNDIWNNVKSLNLESYVFNEFVKGGDNDTSISYHDEDLEEFTKNEVNAALKDIMQTLPIYMQNTMIKYNINQLIEPYATDVVNSIFETHETSFIFKKRDSDSFMIIDHPYENDYLLKKTYNIFKNCLFSSQSFVQFYDNKNQLNKFYLARSKYGFSSHVILMTDENFDENVVINCYAECLDISCPLIDSAKLLEPYTYAYLYSDNHHLFDI